MSRHVIEPVIVEALAFIGPALALGDPLAYRYPPSSMLTCEHDGQGSIPELGREGLEEAAASLVAGPGDETGQRRAGGGCGHGDSGLIVYRRAVDRFLTW